MDIDFLHYAEFLKMELQHFYRLLRNGGTPRAKQLALARLHEAVQEVEPLAEDPGERWDSLPAEQRWGYLQLASHVGTATHELKKYRGQGEPQIARRGGDAPK